MIIHHQHKFAVNFRVDIDGSQDQAMIFSVTFEWVSISYYLEETLPVLPKGVLLLDLQQKWLLHDGVPYTWREIFPRLHISRVLDRKKRLRFMKSTLS